MTALTNLRGQLAVFVGPVAKSIAAFIVPLLALGVAWVVERTGANLPYDPSAVEAAVTSIVTAVLVYLISNRDEPPREPADDGFAEGGVIWTIVGILAIVALIIWIAAKV